MILVTGGTGFIGGHLVEELVKNRKNVCCFVRRTSNINFLKKLNVKLIYGDLKNKKSIQKVFFSNKISSVIHLAAKVRGTNNESYETINVNGTRYLIEESKNYGIKRFVFFSSDDVLYGHKDLYTKSKAECERILSKSSLNYTILRPTTVYGIGDNKNIARLIKMVKKYPILPVLKDYKLQPVYVKDVVKSVVRILDSKKTENKIYNLPGKSLVSFEELVDSISKELGVKIIKIPLSMGSIKYFIKIYERLSNYPLLTFDQLVKFKECKKLDYTEAQKDFGYDPILLKDGIKFTMGDSQKVIS